MSVARFTAALIAIDVTVYADLPACSVAEGSLAVCLGLAASKARPRARHAVVWIYDLSGDQVAVIT